jgi:TPR repeat protein
MDSGIWKIDNNGRFVFILPCTLSSDTVELFILAHQDMNGPKYLNPLGLSETPKHFAPRRIEIRDGDAWIYIDDYLKDIAKPSKKIHVSVCDSKKIELFSCDCMPINGESNASALMETRFRYFGLCVAILTVLVGGMLFYIYGTRTGSNEKLSPPIDQATTPDATATEIQKTAVDTKPLPLATTQSGAATPPVTVLSRQKLVEDAKRMVLNGRPPEMLEMGRKLVESGVADLAAILFREAGSQNLSDGWVELGLLYDPSVIGRTTLIAKDAKVALFNYKRAANAGNRSANGHHAHLIQWLRDRATSNDAASLRIMQEIDQ